MGRYQARPQALQEFTIEENNQNLKYELPSSKLQQDIPDRRSCAAADS